MAIELTCGGPTIFQSCFFLYAVLPFLLVFSVVFAVLQKTEILGKGKKQIDAIVAFVIGLIVVAFSAFVGVIVQLLAFMAVALVVILVFMILLGTVYEPGKFEIGKGIKATFAVLIAIAVTVVVIYLTPAWDYILGLFSGGNTSNLVANVIMVVIIIGAVAAVMFGAKEGSSGEKKP